MDLVIFCHSLRSDWNHGNAHFLRGAAADDRRVEEIGRTLDASGPRRCRTASRERVAG